jgi:twinkle protein
MVDPPGGIITGFSDLPPLSERRILRLGLEPFDWGIAFEEGTMSVCTGVPGLGKSTFVRFCAHHLIRNERIRVGAMELENGVHQMRDHLARLNTGRPWIDLDRTERAALNADLDRHWRVAHRAPAGDVAENLEWLRQRLHALAVRDRCKFIYLDPWNELEHLPEPGETLTSYINFATKSIRQWAERYDTHVCVIAHPKKMPPGSGAPDGYAVADSAAFANKPSLGFTVHQVDGDDPHVRIKVWKVRDQQRYGFGRTTLRVDFDPVAMVYRRRSHGAAQEFA